MHCSLGGAVCMGFFWILITLNIGISGINISKNFASKGYGFVVLDEDSTEATFTGISLQDKGLGAILIGQSGPEKHVANPGLHAVKSLVSQGVPVPICYFFPKKVVLDAKLGRNDCK